MEYTVQAGAQVGALIQDELLSDRLLTALEEFEQTGRLVGPVTGANTATCIVDAIFCVIADEADAAAALGSAIFREALKGAGVPGTAHIEWVRVQEDHEEAATAV